MTYSQYTHNRIVKNTKEVLKNSCINLDPTNKYIQDFTQDKGSEGKAKTIVCSGFINLHCHLAYSNIKLKEQKLFPWLKELLSKIQQRDDVYSPRLNSLGGAKAAIKTGTSFLVENTNYLSESISAFQSTGLKGIIGLEIFGSDPKKANDIFNASIQEIEKQESHEDLQITLSPHASYDVSPELWKLCIDWTQNQSLPLLSHVAESDAEEAWFQNKDSAIAKDAKDFWASINTLSIKEELWQSYPSSIQYLKSKSMLAYNLLLTHMVKARKEDLEEIKKHNISLVSCPRSNEFLLNGMPDYNLWQELELSYALGTDSEASNYDLDMRSEANSIKALNSKDAFELITEKAAKILKEESIGSLNPGQSADFIVFEVDESVDLDSHNIFDLIMNPEISKIKEVYINGSQKYLAEGINISK